MGSCCAGATDVFTGKVGDDNVFAYTLKYDVTGVASPDATLEFKNCGCIALLNVNAQELAKFEPELAWRNVHTGSLYTWQSLAGTLSNNGLKEFSADLVEEWILEDQVVEESVEAHTVIEFSEEEIEAMIAGSTVEFDGVRYKMLGA